MNQKINTIPKTFTREFSLMFCEIWGKAYNNFLGVEPDTKPRYISLIKQGIAITYRNSRLEKELNQIFLDKVNRNPDYLTEFNDEYLQNFSELSKSWTKEYLSKEELSEFINKMIVFWPAIYASLYIPKDDRFSSVDRDLIINLRKTIDIAADKATDVMNRSLQHLYPDLGELVNCLSIENFRNDRIDKEKLSEMFNEQLILVEDVLMNDEEFENLKNKLNFELEKDIIPLATEEIKGQIACPGKVSGIVKIIFKKNEIGKIKVGEILVASMTTPDFLPAMEKAAAFVTDEGGITCHAAIVAREFKKPCIIGTKIATKILKDGDLIEVDANNGLIKILKRVKYGIIRS